MPRKSKIEVLPALPPSEPKTKASVTVSTQVSAPSDRIPPSVWAKLANCGEKAVTQLQNLLSSEQFARMKGSDQLSAIKLALEYAYGKPEGPIKRKVKETFETEDGDAVARLLAAATAAALPEYNKVKSKKNKDKKKGRT